MKQKVIETINWRLIIGFIVVIVGIILLIYSNFRHKEFSLEIEQLRYDLHIKLSAVEKMDSATLARNSSLVLLPLLDNLSRRREEQRKFYQYTRNFLIAKRQLATIDLAPSEDLAFEQVLEKISELDGPILTAMQLLVAEGNTPEAVAAAEVAKAIQADILKQLDKFATSVRETTELRETQLVKDLNDSRNAVSFLSLAVLVLSLVISVVVIWLERVHRLKIIKTSNELAFQKRALDQHDVVSIADAKGNITYVNEKFCSISGYSREELLGRNHRVIRSDEHGPDLFADLWQTIAEGKAWSGEIKNAKKDGGDYWVKSTIVPFLDEHGRPDQYIAISTEITEQKANLDELVLARDAAESAVAAKSEFLSTMSHEIRTPMNGVLGMLRLLLDTDLLEQQRKFAESAMQSGKSLLTIINSILDYSKLESGQLELEETDFNMLQTIDGVCSLVRTRCKPGVTLSTAVDPDVPQWLRADQGRLRQILFNLVGNALKFTDEGSVTIHASARPLAKGEFELKIEIADTGIGLTEETQDKLFARFVQADSSTTRKFGGTGLGLAICKQLAELMGGTIGVESEPNVGSTFWFTICAKSGQAPSLNTLDQPASASVPRWAKPLRILVAEDNHINQMLVNAFIAKAGHSCDLVANGLEAVEAVRAGRYDLVLMDVQMPEMDGPTATGMIRRLPGAAAAVPIVALTANAMEGQREEYLAAGMDDYVSKPIDPVLLARGYCPRLPCR